MILYIQLIQFSYFITGNAFHHRTALEEALSNAISFKDNSYAQMTGKSENYEDKLLHIVGELRIQEPLADYSYNILVSAVKLRKTVQMYQWHEDYTENPYAEGVESGSDSRSYYYFKDWNEKVVDSRSFHSPFTYQNPQQFPMQGKTFTAEKAYIGNFEIGESVKNMMDDWIDVTSDTRPEDSYIKMHLGWYYHVDDLFNPYVGDVRLKFQLAGLQGTSYTIVGKLVNGKIEPYKSKMMRDIILLRKGEMSIDDIFSSEHSSVWRKTWYVRLFGFILILFGVIATESLLKLFEHSRLSFLCPASIDPLKSYIKIAGILTISVCVIRQSLHYIGLV
jgi:hypothetical protein